MKKFPIFFSFSKKVVKTIKKQELKTVSFFGPIALVKIL